MVKSGHKITEFYYINLWISDRTAETNDFQGAPRGTKTGKNFKNWIFLLLERIKVLKKYKNSENQNRFCHPLIMLLDHCALEDLTEPGLNR